MQRAVLGLTERRQGGHAGRTHRSRVRTTSGIRLLLRSARHRSLDRQRLVSELETIETLNGHVGDCWIHVFAECKALECTAIQHQYQRISQDRCTRFELSLTFDAPV